MLDELHEECGVIGIYRMDETRNAAPLVYYGLYALQHRGQESAGIAANNHGHIEMRKGLGLVGEVFRGDALNLTGNIAIGHVRYSTAGDQSIRSAQPLAAMCRLGEIALAHNGNLVNAESLREMLTDEGAIFHSTTDSESILNLICQHGARGVIPGLKNAMSLIKGAYVLVLTIEDKLIGVRDPYGLHPMCIGKFKKEEGYVFASETCALEALDAEFVRDVQPGEIVIADREGLHSIEPSQWCRKKLCVFEMVYFARPDSIVDGVSVYEFRRKCGMKLAGQRKIDADVVMAVPDSGIPAAIGYAEASGIPYGEGLIKNKYMGRTFILPEQEQRDAAVRIKLATIKHNIEGKRLVLIDDSIVRGTTLRRIVKLLREEGAKEIHVCAASPEVRYSCYFGIDTPHREKLIAVQKSVDEICEYIGADSVTYLSEQSLREVCGEDVYCKACFDGNYPMEVPVNGGELNDIGAKS